MDLDWQICPPPPPRPTSIYDRDPAFGDGPPLILTQSDSLRYLASHPPTRPVLPPLKPKIRLPLLIERPHGRTEESIRRGYELRKKHGLITTTRSEYNKPPPDLSKIFLSNGQPRLIANPPSLLHPGTSTSTFHSNINRPSTFKAPSLTPRKRFMRDEDNLFTGLPEVEPRRQGCCRADFNYVSSKAKEDATSFPPVKIVNQKTVSQPATEYNPPPYPPFAVDLPLASADDIKSHTDWRLYHQKVYEAEAKGIDPFYSRVYPYMPGGWPESPPPARPSLRPPDTDTRTGDSKTEPPLMSGALTVRETIPTSPVGATMPQPCNLGDGSSQHATTLTVVVENMQPRPSPLMSFRRVISTVTDAPRQVKRTIQAALQVAHSVKRRAISILDHREVIYIGPPRRRLNSPSTGRVVRYLEVTTTEQRLVQRARRWLAERRRPRVLAVPFSFAEHLSAMFTKAIYGEDTHTGPTEMQNSVVPSPHTPNGVSLQSTSPQMRVKAHSVKHRTSKRRDDKPRNAEAPRTRLGTPHPSKKNHLRQTARNSSVEKPRRVRSINPRTAIKGQVVYFEKDCVLPWHATPNTSALTSQTDLWDNPWPSEHYGMSGIEEHPAIEIALPSPPLASQLSADAHHEDDEALPGVPEDPEPAVHDEQPPLEPVLFPPPLIAYRYARPVPPETAVEEPEPEPEPKSEKAQDKDVFIDSTGTVWPKVRIANTNRPLPFHVAWFDPGSPFKEPISSVQPFNSESPVTSLRRLKPIFSAPLRVQKDFYPRPPERAVRPLSAAWDARVSDIESMSNDEQAATTLTGDPLRVRDLSTCFTSSAWLNDEVINAYLAVIVKYLSGVSRNAGQTDKPEFHAFNSFFFSNLRDKGYAAVRRWATRAKIGKESLLDVDTVFVPVHNNSHWTLIVVRPRTRTIEHFDSLGSLSHAHVAKIKEWLQGELGPLYVESEWNVLPSISPQQNNGSDCGVFLLTTAKALAVGLTPLSYGPADIPIIRRKIVAELVNGGLEGEFDPREFDELKL